MRMQFIEIYIPEIQCAKKIIIIKILHRKTSIIPAVYLYLANNFTWLHNEYIYIMPIIIYLRIIYALWRYSKANMVYSTFTQRRTMVTTLWENCTHDDK